MEPPAKFGRRHVPWKARDSYEVRHGVLQRLLVPPTHPAAHPGAHIYIYIYTHTHTHIYIYI